MNMLILILSIICITVISLIFMKEPLEEREIYGVTSIAIRVFVGIVGGIVVSTLITL